MNMMRTAMSLAVMAGGLALSGNAAVTDNGFYVGLGVGQSTVDADIDSGEGGFSFGGAGCRPGAGTPPRCRRVLATAPAQVCRHGRPRAFQPLTLFRCPRASRSPSNPSATL